MDEWLQETLLQMRSRGSEDCLVRSDGSVHFPQPGKDQGSRSPEQPVQVVDSLRPDVMVGLAKPLRDGERSHRAKLLLTRLLGIEGGEERLHGLCKKVSLVGRVQGLCGDTAGY